MIVKAFEEYVEEFIVDDGGIARLLELCVTLPSKDGGIPRFSSALRNVGSFKSASLETPNLSSPSFSSNEIAAAVEFAVSGGICLVVGAVSRSFGLGVIVVLAVFGGICHGLTVVLLLFSVFVDEGEGLVEDAAANPDEDGLCLGGCVEELPIGSPNARAAALA